MLPSTGKKHPESKPAFLLQKGKITHCIPRNIQTHTPALMRAIVSLKYSSNLCRSEIPIATGWQPVHTSLWIKMLINFFFLNSRKLKHIFNFSEYHLSHLTSGMVFRTVCVCVYKTLRTAISGWMCQAIKRPARIRQYWQRNNRQNKQNHPPWGKIRVLERHVTVG